VSEDAVLVPREFAKKLVESFWFDQWQTRNAAENNVCSYGCGDPYEDFVAHSPDCDFLKEWEELSSLRSELGVTHVPTVREK
jgi:hypothetical protein